MHYAICMDYCTTTQYALLAEYSYSLNLECVIVYQVNLSTRHLPDYDPIRGERVGSGLPAGKCVAASPYYSRLERSN